MKVIETDNNPNSLTQAERDACQQFEASDRPGQALFHPQLAPGQPVPNCVAFLERVGRFCITILPGRYAIEEIRPGYKQWFRLEANGARTPICDPLDGAWQAGTEVRDELGRKLNFNIYTNAVAWFPDTEPDKDILDAAKGSSVNPLFGPGELVQRLVEFPDDEERQTQLNGRYIRKEVGLLSQTSAVVAAPAAEVPPSVKGQVGALVLERVETVNINITLVYGGNADDPPVITVQDR